MRNLLEIIAAGVSLDLFEDTQIQLEYNNMMFRPSEMPETYSLPFDLPSTPRNLRLLNNPTRLASSGIFSELDAELRFTSQHLFTGKLCILETGSRRIRASIVGSSIPVVTKEPLCNIPMAQYDFGPGTIPGDMGSGGVSYAYRQLIQSHITNPVGFPAKNFVAGPILTTEPYPWPLVSIQDSEYRLRPEYVSFYKNSFIRISRNASAWKHYPVHPAVYVGHIIDSIFGSVLVSNPFAQGELGLLCIPSMYHPQTPIEGILIDTCSTPTCDNHYFKLNSFMPSYPASDLIKNLMVMFCMGVYPSGKGTVKMVNYGDIIDGISSVDWSDKLIEFSVKPEPAKTYVAGYDSDIQSKEEPTDTVNTMNDLDSVTIPVSDSEDGNKKFVRVLSNNQLFSASLDKIFDSREYGSNYVFFESYERNYELLDSGLSAAESSASDVVHMVSEMTPLPVTIDPYIAGIVSIDYVNKTWVLRVYKRIVPIADAKTSYDYIPSVLFYRGMNQVLGTDTGTYPLLSPYNYDGRGNRIGEMSLAWEGPDGLLAKHHLRNKEYFERAHRRLVGTFLLTFKDISDLDLTHQVHVRGKNFIVDKVRVTLRVNRIDPATVEMVDV